MFVFVILFQLPFPSHILFSNPSMDQYRFFFLVFSCSCWRKNPSLLFSFWVVGKKIWKTGKVAIHVDLRRSVKKTEMVMTCLTCLVEVNASNQYLCIGTEDSKSLYFPLHCFFHFHLQNLMNRWMHEVSYVSLHSSHSVLNDPLRSDKDGSQSHMAHLRRGSLF